jgi:hypothetical protein
MNMPEYITKQEVQRICQLLGLRDWTQLTEASVTVEEAKIIQVEVGGEAMMISAEAFKQGLDVELEHGIQFPDANVTNNHPILTGMIVLAHLKEMLDYYLRLEVAELQGDMLKALQVGNADKVVRKYQQYLAANVELAEYEQTAASGDAA